MRKFLFGLASGVALIGLAFLVLNAGTDHAPSEAEEILSLRPLADEVTETVAEDNPQNTATDEPELPSGDQESVASANADRQTPKLTAGQLRNLTLEELQAFVETAESQQLYMMVQGEVVRRENIEKWSNERPPTQPITLPPEFAWLSEDPDPRHERLQREAVDPVWSALTEVQIATFLAEHPEITQKYGQPTVSCRTTGCEIAFVAYGVDESAFEIMGQGMFWSVNEQPWANQFWNPGNNLFNARTQGDATTILWHLIKEE